MRSVVVHDGVDLPPGWHAGVDGIEEADELLMPVLLHAASEDGAVKDVQRGKQGHGAMPLIVVRHRAAAAFLQRQAWLRAVECLDLALSSIDRTTACPGGLTYGPTTARSFTSKFGSLDSLNWRIRCGCRPWLRQMRCTELTLIPMTLAIAGAVQWVVSPSGAPRSTADHPVFDLASKRRDARRPGLVAQQAVDALGHEAGLPAPYGGLADAGAAHDLGGAAAIGGQQHDVRPPDVLVRTVAIRNDHRKSLTIVGGEVDADPAAHTADSHAASRRGISVGLFR